MLRPKLKVGDTGRTAAVCDPEENDKPASNTARLARDAWLHWVLVSNISLESTAVFAECARMSMKALR